MAKKPPKNPKAVKKADAGADQVELTEDELQNVTGGGFVASAGSTTTTYNTEATRKIGGETQFLTFWDGCMANKLKR